MATDTPYFGPAHGDKYERHWQDAIPILMGKLRTGKLDSGDVTRLLSNSDTHGGHKECDTDLDTLSNGLRALPVKDRVALANEGLNYVASLTGYNLLQSSASRGSRGGGPRIVTSNIEMKIGVLLDNGGDPNVLIESFLKRSATSCLSSTTVQEGFKAIFSRPEVAARLRPEIADGALNLIKTIDQKTACEFPIRYSFANFRRSIAIFTDGTLEGDFYKHENANVKNLSRYIPNLLAAGGRFRTPDGKLEPQLVNGVKTTSHLAIAAEHALTYVEGGALLKKTGSLGDHPVTALRAINPAFISRNIDAISATGVTFNEQDDKKKTILHHLLETIVQDYKDPKLSYYPGRNDYEQAARAILKSPGINTALKDENGVSVATLVGKVNEASQAYHKAAYDKERANSYHGKQLAQPVLAFKP